MSGRKQIVDVLRRRERRKNISYQIDGATLYVSSRRTLSLPVSSQRGYFGPPVPPGLRIISARDGIDRPDSQEEIKRMANLSKLHGVSLTDAFVRNANSGGQERLEISDMKTPGLVLRIPNFGKKTFILRARGPNKENVYRTIGAYPI